MKTEIIATFNNNVRTRNVTNVSTEADYIRTKLSDLSEASLEYFKPLKVIKIAHKLTNDFLEFNFSDIGKLDKNNIDKIITELFKRIIDNEITHITIYDSGSFSNSY